MTTIPISKWREETFAVHVTHGQFQAHRIAAIESAVCQSFGLPKIDALHERTRRLQIAWPRQVCMFLLMRALGMTTREASDHFGLYRCLGTQACRVVNDRMDAYPKERKRILGLLEKFQ